MGLDPSIGFIEVAKFFCDTLEWAVRVVQERFSQNLWMIQTP